MGTSRFGYGGSGIIPYHDDQGRTTLFIGGHAQRPGQVAQVEVPSALGKGPDYADLPVAPVLQIFAAIADGNLDSRLGITSDNGSDVYGLFPYGGKLLVSANEYYGCTQTLTHGFSSLDLSRDGDFSGFFPVTGSAHARAIAGPMAEVPAEWRSLLGGEVLGGNWSLPIIGCNSAGPAVTAFHPDSLYRTGTSEGTTLLFHPLGAGADHALCAGAQCERPAPEAETSEIYNLATRFGGLAFPAGSRSLLFFGRQGIGPYCYGTPDECGGDPAEPDAKGPHAYPYRFQIWAYDAADLAKVGNGSLKSYEPRPYGIWAVDDLDAWTGKGMAKIRGAGFDAVTGRWYITTDYGEEPRVDVFLIHPASEGLRGPAKPEASFALRTRRGPSGSWLFDIPGWSDPRGGRVSYRIRDIRGRRLAEIHSAPGKSAAVWEAARREPGVLLVTYGTRNRVRTARIAALRTAE